MRNCQIKTDALFDIKCNLSLESIVQIIYDINSREQRTIDDR